MNKRKIERKYMKIMGAFGGHKATGSGTSYIPFRIGNHESPVWLLHKAAIIRRVLKNETAAKIRAAARREKP